MFICFRFESEDTYLYVKTTAMAFILDKNNKWNAFLNAELTAYVKFLMMINMLMSKSTILNDWIYCTVFY